MAGGVSEFASFDLDRATARAWRQFQARLADRLAEMTDDDALVVETQAGDLDSDEVAPYVQFAGWGEGTMLRGEVSSNAYVAERYAIGEDEDERLRAWGWQAPTVGPGEPDGSGSPHYFVDLARREADRLAVMAVRALREVFGVTHPAFLSAPGLGEAPPPWSGGDGVAAGACVDGPQGGDDTSDPPYDEALAVVPDSPEHLARLVDAALTPLFGAAPVRDADGDIPVPYGSSLVFVRVDSETPVVHLFSVVAEDVADRERALFEVNVLNRDLRFVTFSLVGGRILARILLPAQPFVPRHLRSMLSGLCSWIDDLDEDLVARVGGRRALARDDASEEDGRPRSSAAVLRADSSDAAPRDDSADETELPVELRTLVELDVDESDSVDPELAATICHDDVELVLALLRRSERQELEWGKARDEALLEDDEQEAAVCDGEREAWRGTTTLLRRALRVIVERAAGRPGRDEPSY